LQPKDLANNNNFLLIVTCKLPFIDIPDETSPWVLDERNDWIAPETKDYIMLKNQQEVKFHCPESFLNFAGNSAIIK
jgi:hypothetical protein